MKLAACLAIALIRVILEFYYKKLLDQLSATAAYTLDHLVLC